MENSYGRTKIEYSAEVIDDSNVVEVLSDCVGVHQTNEAQIQTLYEYYCGKQDIEQRTKEVRPEIMNIITENHAYEIVTFKVGYLMGDTGAPTQYTAVIPDATERVVRLNTLMEYASKDTFDSTIFEWDNIAGTAYGIALGVEDEEQPFRIAALDPRRTFVIYSTDIFSTPLAGVYRTVNEEGEDVYTVYTNEKVYTILDDEIIDRQPNPIGLIPIIEYPANNARLGSFEICGSLLDALNNLSSNRMDSVEQFVQSLLVLYNAELDDDVTANSIRQAGMILLRSINENKADVKVISEVLNQSETQTLKEDLYDTILTICSMPNRNGGSSTSDNGLAVVYRDGWQAAETAAKASETMYLKSDREFRKVLFRIFESLSLVTLTVDEVKCNFTRHPQQNIASKSQVLIAMLNNNKIHPKDAYEASGMFVDTEKAYQNGMEWYESHEEVGETVTEDATEV